jgi:hypothetical protein
MQAESSCTAVVVADKPKPGKEADCSIQTRTDSARQDLADRSVIACQAKDGTV